MKTFGKPTQNQSRNNSYQAKGNTGEAKKRPVFDLCAKDLGSDGKVNRDAEMIKLAGLFENVKEDGSVYYSGTSAATGQRIYLFLAKEKPAERS